MASSAEGEVALWEAGLQPGSGPRPGVGALPKVTQQRWSRPSQLPPYLPSSSPPKPGAPGAEPQGRIGLSGEPGSWPGNQVRADQGSGMPDLSLGDLGPLWTGLLPAYRIPGPWPSWMPRRLRDSSVLTSSGPSHQGCDQSVLILTLVPGGSVFSQPALGGETEAHAQVPNGSASEWASEFQLRLFLPFPHLPHQHTPIEC